MTDAIVRAERMIADALPDGADGPSGPALAAALRDSGLLAECLTLAHHPRDPLILLDALQRVGSANLSAGRLFEGHVNAVKLLMLHDGPTAPVAQGALYGDLGRRRSRPRADRGFGHPRAEAVRQRCGRADHMIVTVGRMPGCTLLMFARATSWTGGCFPANGTCRE